MVHGIETIRKLNQEATRQEILAAQGYHNIDGQRLHPDAIRNQTIIEIKGVVAEMEKRVSHDPGSAMASHWFAKLQTKLTSMMTEQDDSPGDRHDS